jgi:hypothetical protein
MDTDLEVIIKDNTIVLTPANVKSYILQTLQGLEYLHIHWILHRVSAIACMSLTHCFGEINVTAIQLN